MKEALWRILKVGFFTSLLVVGGCDSFDGDDGAAGAVGGTGAAGAAGAAGADGAAGAAGATGAAGADAVDTGTITGTVKNALSSEVLAGVSVSGSGITTTTDASGVYTLADVAIGSYDLTFSLANYSPGSTSANVIAGSSNTKNVSLSPVATVVASVDTASVTAAYGEAITLTASVACFDGRASCGTSYAWEQTFGPAVVATGSENAATETYTMPTAQVTKDNVFENVLFDSLLSRSGAALTDRMFVHGINPFLLEEEGKEIKFEVTATVANGETATAEVVVTLPDLPYDISPGLVNVPVDRVAVAHGPGSFSAANGGAGYTWTLTATPVTSALTSASLGDAATQHVYFTPDVSGTYTLSVTDATTTATIDVIAGTWQGAISFSDTTISADGKPDSIFCTVCHQDRGIAPDKFTSWRESGHAHILTTNLNTSTHYGTGCFMCHTVGYDPTATNGGIDEAGDFDEWLASGIFNVPNAENWATTVSDYPDSARLANIQCENCHGPNVSDAHMTAFDNTMTGGTTAARVSLQSDVCGACHGEPLRHARFQQWQESGHNNQRGLRYGAAELRPATDTNAGAGHCGRCHNSQGFRRWIKQDVSGKVIDLTDNIIGADGEVFGVVTTAAYQAALIDLGMNENEATSQSCATCHMVHNPGTVTGDDNDVIMRVTADNIVDTPAGFEVSGLGLGNLCASCHNGRNGAHNDSTYNAEAAVPTFFDGGTPHYSVQADLIMGENAFFVDVGQRAAHSYIKDSCAKCHMELTPPPAELSYNLGGTNHTFEASTVICTECHGAFDGGSLKDTIEAKIEQAQELYLDVLSPIIDAYIADAVIAGGTIRIVDDDATCTTTTLPAGGLYSISWSHGDATFCLDASCDGATEVVAPLTGTDATCGMVGLVEYDGAATPGQVTLVTEDDLDTGANAGEFAMQTWLKANWNILYIEGDGSDGIHNPSFALEVLTATVEELEALE